MTLLSNAGIAQLVERNLAKVEVESSRLFSRSRFKKRKPERLPFLFPASFFASFFCFIPPLRSCSFSFICDVIRQPLERSRRAGHAARRLARCHFSKCGRAGRCLVQAQSR